MMMRIIIIFILLLLPGNPFAGELVLVKGEGIPVCEAHFDNLQTLSLDEMVCKRDDYYPNANGITRPTWEKLDLRENKELVKRIHKFFGVGDQFGALKVIDEEFEHYLNQDLMRSDLLYRTMVDIDNDGKPEKVMRYSDGICMESHAYSRPLFVPDDARNLLNVKKTEPLLQNPFPRNIEAKAVNSGYQLYDIFIYRNGRYFDKWSAPDWTLSVYNISKRKTKEVCRYQYSLE